MERKEIGRRLRRAREACGMTQEEVARALGVSRSSVAQMELGNRMVSGLELARLAFLYGRDMREFVEDEELKEDPLLVLFRRHADLAGQAGVQQALRECVALGRELAHLEHLLGVDRAVGLGEIPEYRLPRPRTKREAVQQGEHMAGQERRRLGLEAAPVANMAELLESEGVHTARIPLPDEVSGLTLIHPEIGCFVFVNRMHHVLRRRFSLAHEYCHVLLDRSHGSTISREGTNDLLEVRANAFAAAFLMPEEGVRAFIHSLGKERRSGGGIQLYDVVQLAHHFRVSRESACYRLRDLGLLTKRELQELLHRERGGLGRALEKALHLGAPCPEEEEGGFQRRFFVLALEAFRRGLISQAKLVELAGMVDVRREEVERIASGLVEEEEGEMPVLSVHDDDG